MQRRNKGLVTLGLAVLSLGLNFMSVSFFFFGGEYFSSSTQVLFTKLGPVHRPSMPTIFSYKGLVQVNKAYTSMGAKSYTNVGLAQVHPSHKNY